MHERINDWCLCEDTKRVVSIELKLLKQSLTNTDVQSNFYKHRNYDMSSYPMIEITYERNSNFVVIYTKLNTDSMCK